MPERDGETSGTRALDLRLWVPAQSDLRSIAGELAAKVAEFLGADAPDAQSLAEKVAGLASTLANGGQPSHDIALEFRQVNGELVVEARCAGAASEIRQGIPV
jgi:hypothetical protein